jgi:tRNA dimethylallyltransferase
LTEPRPLVTALFGPTGVGKTAVALELAALLRERGEDPVAVSCDSLQVYEGLARLTGAVTEAERARLEHRLVGVVPVSDSFSIREYMPMAHAEIDAALEAGRRPIVLGGTGLYLRAALAELSLEKVAPGEESELWSPETRHPTATFALTMERERLYRRVDARVDAIVASGAEEEVRAAEHAAGRTARKALGFQELLAGDIDGMKRRSRNYARRQMTWLRKLPNVVTLDVTGKTPVETAREIAPILAAREAP